MGTMALLRARPNNSQERRYVARNLGVVGGLQHVEINESDLARSVEFWGWLLPELGYDF